MKCRFLVPTKPLNPDWSAEAALAAERAGVPYDVPRQLAFKAGYIVEHPQAWIHCCPGDMNSAPIAEPADEECREAVREWMTVNRPAGIAQIKAQLEQIDMLENPADKDRLLKLGRAYGLIGSSKPVHPVGSTAVAAESDDARVSQESATTVVDRSETDHSDAESDDARVLQESATTVVDRSETDHSDEAN